MGACPRTLCLFKPGVPLDGVEHYFQYNGTMPLTGDLVCPMCGQRKEEILNQEAKTEGATKFDGAKPRVDLLDPLALEGIARVLEFGARKYAAHNWRNGMSWSRMIGALLRHTFAIMRGEDIDPESGLPHVDHLGCCWMFLSNYMKTGAGTDDRWKPADDKRLPALGEPARKLP